MPAPSMPGGKPAEPAASLSATLNNAVHLHAYQDPDQLAASVWSKGGDHYLVWLGKNGQAVKQTLGIN